MSMVFTQGSNTLTLPSPDYGDSVRIDTNAVIRQNRHGTAIVYKDSDWPTIYTRTFEFKTLTADDISNLKTFLDDTIGLETTLVDYDDTTWVGYFVTSDPEIITLKDNCSYDVRLEFLGDEQ